jgi:hypothetical protein
VTKVTLFSLKIPSSKNTFWHIYIALSGHLRLKLEYKCHLIKHTHTHTHTYTSFIGKLIPKTHILNTHSYKLISFFVSTPYPYITHIHLHFYKHMHTPLPSLFLFLQHALTPTQSTLTLHNSYFASFFHNTQTS